MCLFRFYLLYVLRPSLGHSILVLLAFVVLGLVFQYLAKILAGKNFSEITYFVSSGT